MSTKTDIFIKDRADPYITKGSDGYYTLVSGNKIAVNESTGAIYTYAYYDLDGKVYNVKKNGDKYSLYLGNKEITEKIERSETRKTDTGEEYTHTFYSYFITSFGTLVSVDAENGTLSVCAVREYDSKGEKYTPYYFILRSGNYMLSDKDGNITADTLPIYEYETVTTLNIWRIDDEPIVIVCTGDVKIANPKYKATFHKKAKMIPFDMVTEITGHEPGGVCPFALPCGVRVYLDESMKRFDTVYPAAGTASSAVKLSCEELFLAAQAIEWVDVCKMREQ
jgi:prolyl-tRNA editing enzyme YbaK/EbsC (Cys-tRNA(Pro) deacylase)